MSVTGNHAIRTRRKSDFKYAVIALIAFYNSEAFVRNLDVRRRQQLVEQFLYRNAQLFRLFRYVRVRNHAEQFIHGLCRETQNNSLPIYEIKKRLQGFTPEQHGNDNVGVCYDTHTNNDTITSERALFALWPCSPSFRAYAVP